MRKAVGDVVYRMSGDGELAKICMQVVSDLEDGSVCRRIESDDDLSVLGRSPQVVARVDGDPEAETVKTPFVLVGDLLYTRRNWIYEQMVRRRMVAMIDAPADVDVSVPTDGFYAGLRGEQRQAVEAVCRNRLAILSGGPGTGKTFTVARAVNFIMERTPDLRLALAAPTGKAAARMEEAMNAAMKAFGAGPDGTPKTVSLTARTLHSLLESNYDLVTFRHNHGNPLPIDWLIVDEASMIDLPLMAKLLDALPDTCRLTLVGDVDQLASVERGHVFGDLCRMPGVSLSRLEESARFPPGGAIARLAAAVNGNRAEEAVEILSSGDDVVSFVDLTPAKPFEPQTWKGFLTLVENGFKAFAASTSAEDALAHLNDFRVLCALRNGPFGAERVNAFVKSRLGGNGPVPWMITQNDHTLGVSNGDIGVVMPNEPGEAQYVCLEAPGGVRKIRAELLPSKELAFASTIHKAQGSEYRDVAILMPPQGDSSLLTREILYTGITRAKGKVHVYAGPASVKVCCEHKVERASGLLALHAKPC
ncbi:MAG: exodeoxyribonuclease V subunit alpha [Kiritimatiellae bacterium]|nr:exodeoxyribonuclease V subunit alpha [Kiritimatiellia bacterium]